MEDKKFDYIPHQENDIDLERLKRADIHTFVRLCESAGYMGFIFDYFSKRGDIAGLERALEVSRKLRNPPMEEIANIFNKLERAYLQAHAEMRGAAKEELGRVHGSVFDGAYSEAYKIDKEAKRLAEKLDALPERAREFGLGREGEYAPEVKASTQTQ